MIPCYTREWHTFLCNWKRGFTLDSKWKVSLSTWRFLNTFPISRSIWLKEWHQRENRRRKSQLEKWKTVWSLSHSRNAADLTRGEQGLPWKPISQDLGQLQQARLSEWQWPWRTKQASDVDQTVGRGLISSPHATTSQRVNWSKELTSLKLRLCYDD